MNQYTYAAQLGKSMPLGVLLEIYDAMGAKAKTVFHDKECPTFEDFGRRVSDSVVVAVLDVTSKRWAFVAWFDVLRDGWVDSHFCGLAFYRPEMAKLAMSVMHNKVTPDAKGFVGQIKRGNKLARKMVEKLGWQMVDVDGDEFVYRKPFKEE